MQLWTVGGLEMSPMGRTKHTYKKKGVSPEVQERMRHEGDREGNREAQGKIRAHLMAWGPTGAGGGSRVSILEQERLRGIW